MGYGFCIPDNPHDSVSLKLPGDGTLYSITRSDLVPQALISTFWSKQILTPRERLTKIRGIKPSTKAMFHYYKHYLSK